MAKIKLQTTLIGIRIPYGSTSRVDKPVAVDSSTPTAGILEVAEVHQPTEGAVQTIGTSWAYKFGGTTTSPYLLIKLEVLNPTGSAETFSLAMMSTPSGSPTTSNAFLAWSTAISANSVFSWTGAAPLIDRYIYAMASTTGLLLYRELQSIVPE